ncbi:MAG: sigma-70 family RNA polymerase sigma factor [Arachidicoccus sp.]|nr:sigma-70 family RNA polymerase sigma factor [Arachidicoccus sp.]
MSRISLGDEQAFTAIFHQYYPSVYRATLFITASGYLAEETVQDVFLKLWLSKEKLTAIENFESYLFIVARNQAYKALQKKVRMEMLQNTTNAEDSFDPMDNHDLEMQKDRIRGVYEAAVDSLPEQQKRVYQLSKQSDLSRKHIAALMQLSPESVKKYLALANLHIRAYCQKNAPELLPALVILLIMQQLPK